METSMHKKILIVLIIVIIVSGIININYKFKLEKTKTEKEYYKEQMINIYELTESQQEQIKKCANNYNINYEDNLIDLENILID